MRNKLVTSLAGILGFALYSSTAIGSRYNLPEPINFIAQDIYDQHIVAMWVCVAIFIAVFGVMLYSILRHRKSRGYKAANFHHSTLVEVIWTVIPIIILVALSWPATITLINMKNTSESDMTIKVTGYQWLWGYDYLQGEGEGISFYSRLATPAAQINGTEPKGENYLLEVDNNLVVPVGKRIRLLITASDVLHAWGVPALAVKQDAIPGFIRDSWFEVDNPGIYRGQCTELCGKDHGFMPIVVEALEADKYAEWVAAQQEKLTANKTSGVQEVDLVDGSMNGQGNIVANERS